MVYQPCRTMVQQCVIAGSLALSCLWSTSILARTCPVYNFSESVMQGATLSAPNRRVGTVTLELEKGLLQPQLEAFITTQFPVDTIDWRVSPHYQWPATFTLQAPNAQEVLERLITPYQFAVTFYANRSAVISYRYSSSEAL